MKFKDMSEHGKTYVIAEAGANHNGDMELAKRLIDSAVACGADCVKFQSWTKDSIFSKKVYQDNFFLRDDYRNRTDYTLEQIVDKYHIDKKKHIELKNYCEEKGIEFASTPFSRDEVDLLIELDVPFIKVASMDLNNIPFLEYIATKGKPVILSTGLCPLSDVALAVETLQSNHCTDIILLHCVSIYPPRNDEVNLNNIDMLRTCFDVRVGYSDHTIGTVAPVMSLAKGVCVIEKHFTLDKAMEGWDHKISASPEELSVICEAAKIGHLMLGSRVKTVNEDRERREAFQRSIVAARQIEKGMVISEDAIDYKRPGTGIAPKYYKSVVGRTAKRDIAYDEIISWEDF
ncbi:MAG: N-acetylneuraminate synthase [Lachnospiraceae bacterium]|nr:N-acetylneuraminate synthase [Lachnospiraceae bacterium]